MKQRVDDLIQKELVDHYEKYYRLAYSYVHNEADAMDIVQEGAYKAILKSDKLQQPEYVETWIYRIMINTALDFIKKYNKPYVELETITNSTIDTYQDIDLKKAIEELGEPDKTIIKLRFFEDMKIEQISEIIEENVNTVKSRLYRSVKKLRLALE